MALKPLKTLAGAWIICLLCMGCATMQEKQRMEDFSLTSNAYAKAMRWSQFELAYVFHRGSLSGEDLPDFEKLKNYKVVNYNLLGVFPSEDKHRVSQVVEIRYFRTDTMVVRSAQKQQLWVYDDTEERWFIESRFPDFK